MLMRIGYDRQASSELDAKYYVYDEDYAIIYKGTYTQCLIVIGAVHVDPTITVEEIKNKTNGMV